jgi:hypothetical protein
MNRVYPSRTSATGLAGGEARGKRGSAMSDKDIASRKSVILRAENRSQRAITELRMLNRDFKRRLLRAPFLACTRALISNPSSDEERA